MPNFLKVAKPVHWTPLQTLTVGSGFTGATPQPAAVGPGTGYGFTANPCVRWTDVPNQSFATDTTVSVAAFHCNGIDRVEFQANNGPVITVRQQSINPVTGVVSYCVNLGIAGVTTDQKIEVRATVYPKTCGNVRVMQGTCIATDGSAYPPLNGVYSYWCWSNVGGTYTRTPIYVATTGNDTSGDGSSGNPYQTVNKAAQRIKALYTTQDGGRIICRTGTYTWDCQEANTTYGLANDRWLSIEAYPGETVTLLASRPQQNLLRLKGCRLDCVTGGSGNIYVGYNSGNLHNLVWMEDCTVIHGTGRYDLSIGNAFTLNTCRGYAIRCTYNDCINGPTDVIIARDCTADKLSENFVYQAEAVFNCRVNDIDPADTGNHGDVWQWYLPGSDLENLMVLNLKSTRCLSQGLHFAEGEANLLRDSAFVNFSIDHLPDAQTTQIAAPYYHVMFLNCTWHNQNFLVRSASYDANTTFVGNYMYGVSVIAPGTTGIAATAFWDQNHFAITENNITPGTNFTTGTGPSLTWTSDKQNPVSGGTLSNRLTRSQNIIDADNRPRGAKTTLGAYSE